MQKKKKATPTTKQQKVRSRAHDTVAVEEEGEGR
jgi:hypothetical protein